MVYLWDVFDGQDRAGRIEGCWAVKLQVEKEMEGTSSNPFLNEFILFVNLEIFLLIFLFYLGLSTQFLPVFRPDHHFQSIHQCSIRDEFVSVDSNCFEQVTFAFALILVEFYEHLVFGEPFQHEFEVRSIFVALQCGLWAIGFVGSRPAPHLGQNEDTWVQYPDTYQSILACLSSEQNLKLLTWTRFVFDIEQWPCHDRETHTPSSQKFNHYIAFAQFNQIVVLQVSD